MKRDNYLAALETVTRQAVTLWDVVRMRDAMIEARRKLEQKYMELKRADFSTR